MGGEIGEIGEIGVGSSSDDGGKRREMREIIVLGLIGPFHVLGCFQISAQSAKPLSPCPVLLYLAKHHQYEHVVPWSQYTFKSSQTTKKEKLKLTHIPA